MNSSRLEQGLVAGAVAYLLVVGWMMANMSYDVWGALVVGPPLALIGLFIVNATFRGELRPVGVIMAWGLLAKLVGTLARYWVGVEAYGGAIDANRYHQVASEATIALRNGETSWWNVFPTGTGTPFVENLTSFLYAITGATKLGAFLVFGFIGYLGVMWFVKAACVAVPGLARRRYAVLCAFAPSLIYWPSSIGKEAWMMATLGLGTLGIAYLLARRGVLVPLAICVLGFGLASVVRPHMVLLWLAGTLPALLVALMRGRGVQVRGAGHGWDRVLVVAVAAVALVALSTMSQVTLKQLNFAEDSVTGTTTVSSILTETSRRTGKAGSNFRPPSVAGPTDWPYASARTLMRPLIIEARNVVQLVTAVELTLLVMLGLWFWGRTQYLPRALITSPYVAFAMSTVFLVGLAFSSFANMGLLARQKSLIFPFLLLIPCMPVLRRRDRTVVLRSATERRELAAVGG